MFQHMMHAVFHGLDGVFVYLNNVLVTTSSLSSTPTICTHSLPTCRKMALSSTLRNACSEKHEVDILGHRVDAPCIFVPFPPALMLCTRSPPFFATPTVAVSQFNQLLPSFPSQAAPLLHPLHCLCRSWHPFSTLTWDNSSFAAFDAAKDLLSFAILLAHLIPDSPLQTSSTFAPFQAS